MTPSCPCGEASDHVVAVRQTIDGFRVVGWHSGAVAVLGVPSGAVAVTALAWPGPDDVWWRLSVVELTEAHRVSSAILCTRRESEVYPPSAPIDLDPIIIPREARDRVEAALRGGQNLRGVA